MTGAPRLHRVVAHLGAVLVAIQQLHRGVGVQDPRRVQGLAAAVRQGAVHPGRAPGQLGFARGALFFPTALGRRRQVRQCPAQPFVADDPPHAQYLRRHGVAAQCSDMGITSLAIEDRQQPSAQHVAHLRCVGAAVAHRAAFDPVLEQPRYLQKLGKERQLPQRRGTAALVPAHLKAPTRRAHPQLRRLLDLFLNRAAHGCHQRAFLKFRLTHRVILPVRLKAPSALSLHQFRGRQLRKIGLFWHRPAQQQQRGGDFR